MRYIHGPPSPHLAKPDGIFPHIRDAVAPQRNFDWGGTDSGPSNPPTPKFRFLLGFRSLYLENLEKS